MTQRIKFIVLTVLLVVLAGVVFNFYRTRYSSDRGRSADGFDGCAIHAARRG